LRALFRVLVLVALSTAPPIAAKTRSSAASRSAPVDRDYVSALAAANRFLTAWQTHDQETGLLVLTDDAKHRTSEDHLRQFFSPTGGTQEAYEIGHGKKLATGRYSFPVVLFEAAPGHEVKPTRPRSSHIIVTRAGKEDWAIDKLP